MGFNDEVRSQRKDNRKKEENENKKLGNNFISKNISKLQCSYLYNKEA